MDTKTVLDRLRAAREVHTLISYCTNRPFLHLHGGEYVAYVYENGEDIKREGLRFVEQEHPIRMTRIDGAALPAFAASLAAMGVNTVALNAFTDKACRVAVGELSEDAARYAANGAVHLLALRYMQELRRKEYAKMPRALRELQKELLSRFAEGTYLVLVDAEDSIPLIRSADGSTCLPLYTDALEAGRVQVKEGMRIAAITADQAIAVLPASAKGIVLNPGGVDLLLPVQRKTEA